MGIGEIFTVRGIPAAVRREFKLTCLKKRERMGAAVANLMIQYVAESGYETDLWPGFKRAFWSSVSPGQEVWLAEQEGGRPIALGPHTVADREGRTLRNAMGTPFWNHKETLLRRVT